MTNLEHDSPQTPERRQSDAVVAALREHVKAVRDDINELKTVMREMAAAMTKLALVEERQTQTSAATARAFAAIAAVDAKADAISARVTDLEKADIQHDRTSAWVDKAAWGALGFIASYFAGKLLGG